MQPIVKDSDGNTYETVIIGEQVWVAQNLKVSAFRNGDPIPEAKTDEEWQCAGKTKEPAWCYNENDPENDREYGKLYNWFAVTDPRGIAPEGYHIPSKKEFKELLKNVNVKGRPAYDELRLGGSSGFNSLFGGSRLPNCQFSGIGKTARYWSDTSWFKGNAGGIYIISVWETAKWCSDYCKCNGYSVRCLKD
ncbi:MAG: fibrobacter succinogenes major paralogous domain-containing protein [Candidatus Latescibacterota bacterium]